MYIEFCSCIFRGIFHHTPLVHPGLFFGFTILNNHQVEDLAVSKVRDSFPLSYPQSMCFTQKKTQKCPQRKHRNVYFYVGRRVLILRCLQSKEPHNKRCCDVVLPESLYYAKLEQTNQTCKMLTTFSAIHLNKKNYPQLISGLFAGNEGLLFDL